MVILQCVDYFACCALLALPEHKSINTVDVTHSVKRFWIINNKIWNFTRSGEIESTFTQLPYWDYAWKHVSLNTFFRYDLPLPKLRYCGIWLEPPMISIMLRSQTDDLFAPIVPVLKFPDFSVHSFCPKINPSEFGSSIKEFLSTQNLSEVAEYPIRTRLSFS
jgi:hypothetical protein